MDPRIVPACLLLLLVVPAASAVTFDDATGDVRLRVLNQWQENATGWDGVDVTTLTVDEDPSFFRFTVDVLDLTFNEGGAKHDAATYAVTFTHGGKPHMVSIVRNVFEDAWYGNLFDVDADGRARWLGPLDAAGSDETGTAWVAAPRHAFLDASGAPPVRGGVFKDLTLTAASHSGGFTCCITVPDVNSGHMVQAVDVVEAGDYPIQYGGRMGEGGLRLSALHPFRASNGGAATLRYNVQAAYAPDGDAQDAADAAGGGNRTFALRAEGVPEGWSVTLPETLTLAAGDRVELSVVAETPFVHQHGGSDGFDLVLEPTDGPAAHAHVRLGVHYLDVPQPSGHHPRLWLHSIALGEFNSRLGSALGGADGRLYMNALEEDPGDEAFAVTMAQWGTGSTQWRLYACLEPGLLMGLDLDGAGRIELPVASDLPAEATLSGRVLHLGPGPEVRSCYPGSWGDRDVTELATLSGVATGVGSAPTLLEAAVDPVADRVAYADGAQLVLELVVDMDDVGRLPGSVTVHPGGVLDLPLQEYRDSRPAGLVGTVVEEGGPEPVASTEVAGKDSPGVGLLAAVLAVFAVALLRRRD